MANQLFAINHLFQPQDGPGAVLLLSLALSAFDTLILFSVSFSFLILLPFFKQFFLSRFGLK